MTKLNEFRAWTFRAKIRDTLLECAEHYGIHDFNPDNRRIDEYHDNVIKPIYAIFEESNGNATATHGAIDIYFRTDWSVFQIRYGIGRGYFYPVGLGKQFKTLTNAIKFILKELNDTTHYKDVQKTYNADDSMFYYNDLHNFTTDIFVKRGYRGMFESRAESA